MATDDSAVAASPLHGLPLTPAQRQIVNDSLALFGSKPSLEILKRSWSPDAGFEDPIALCRGFAQYAPQWFAMPMAFPKSETLDWRVTRAEPRLIEYEQTQKYTIRLLNVDKIMKSLVHIELNEAGQITHFEDRWNGKPLPSNFISRLLRRANANFVPWIVSVPRDDAKLD